MINHNIFKEFWAKMNPKQYEDDEIYPIVENSPSHFETVLFYTLLFIIIIFFLSLTFFVNQSHAESHNTLISDDVALHCILGEARGEGFESLKAHSEALRNRNTTKGVYGCKAKFNEPKRIWDLARKAWLESEYSNTVSGADHWASIKLDQNWIKKMKKAGYVMTARVNGTEFYRKP